MTFLALCAGFIAGQAFMWAALKRAIPIALDDLVAQGWTIRPPPEVRP